MVTSSEQHSFSFPDYVMTASGDEADLKNMFRNTSRQDCDDSPV